MAITSSDIALPDVIVGLLDPCDRSDPAGTEAWTPILDRLDELGRLVDNWDGDGALAPNPEVMSGVRAALDSMKARGLQAPSRLVAAPDGWIVAEWQRPGLYIDIEFAAPHRGEGIIVRDEQPAQHWSMNW